MRARETASDVVGLAHTVTLRAHNVTTGMTDYKFAYDELGLFDSAQQMFVRMQAVLDALVIDPQRAREELEAEWTTSMELADTLEREHKVPFRIGHSFASAVVGHARQEGFVPADFPYAEAQRLFTRAADKYEWKTRTLPLDEAAFRATLSPENMVRTASAPAARSRRRSIACSRRRKRRWPATSTGRATAVIGWPKPRRRWTRPSAAC